jgi:uncharacterized protein YkwD
LIVEHFAIVFSVSFSAVGLIKLPLKRPLLKFLTAYLKDMRDRTPGLFAYMLRGIVLTALLSAYLFAAPLAQPINLSAMLKQRSNVFSALSSKEARAGRMSQLEEEMVELINDERTRRGLEPLEPDDQLARVARRHSADMSARGYFSHNSPEGKDAFDRMRDANIRFRAAAENLARARTVASAHTGLMNSPLHRTNILSRKYGRVGIGIVKTDRGLMISQVFRD